MGLVRDRQGQLLRLANDPPLEQKLMKTLVELISHGNTPRWV